MQSMSQAKRLRALWVAVVLLGIMVLGLLGYITSKSNPFGVQAVLSPGPPSESPTSSWEGLSLQEKLQRSSAVVFAELRPDNDQLRAVATDVLVLAPGTEIHYRPGQEVPSLSQSTSGITDWGDGAVALLAGSPASIQESYSVRNGRVSGLGDISIEELKRLALAR